MNDVFVRKELCEERHEGTKEDLGEIKKRLNGIQTKITAFLISSLLLLCGVIVDMLTRTASAQP